MVNITNRLFSIALLTLFIFNLNPIHAQTNTSVSVQQWHSHQNIISVAQQFLDMNIDKTQYSRINIQLNQLDPRLNLSQCPQPLTSKLAPGSQFTGKTTVHLRCNSSRPWTVYIIAQISLYGLIVETSKPLSKDHVLKENDLVLSEKDLSRIKYGYFVKKDHLIGKQLRRRLPQNKIIKSNYVKDQTLVKRGENVSIIAEKSGYSVKMTGTAMASGSLGERIRVKNISSKRIIEGIIKRAGVVSIH
ncbi:hypothetical protein MNBD_GAMMA07-2616 [hydrothermal vent metagenome]|uniref:Flagella basal body P-ring formation protein FlgA n=1 Tax=hydrothermal vent metagenome TaxID=652676 RepID=A0A3B0WZ45_9ZZZZ